MAELFLFNPENDPALAAGTANFTPPRGAAALRDAGSSLPAWWGANDDGILGMSNDEAERLRREFGISVRNCPRPGDIPSPWGWSEYARRIFQRAGVEALPDDELLNRMRQLSHRRTSMTLLRAMDIDDVRECRSVDEVEAALSEGDKMLKSPWSCSGRGVMATKGLSRDEIRRHAAGIIRRQGSVMVEPMLERKLDFAALYDATDAGVRFVGWSVFSTADSGAYTGNAVAPQSIIAEKIASMISIDRLEQAARDIARHLTLIICNGYRGPLGVDMMIYGLANSLRPAIEVNLRRTMGRAALDINRRLDIAGTLVYTPAVAGHDLILSQSASGSGFVIKGATPKL